MTNYNEYIEKSCEHFRNLLISQIERAKKMKNASSPKDFSKLDKITIGVIYGDGIGPIITSEAEKILFILLEDEIASGKIEIRRIEGLTIENRLEKGKSVPDDVLDAIKGCDVLLKGPTTTPNGGKMESANVSLRRSLDLYANVRPVSIPEQNIDWTFFRENTEGEYTLGSKGIEIPETLAMDFKVTTDEGTKRIARAAYEFARKNGKKSVAIVTKANIMKKTDGKFSLICHEVAKDYPEIATDEYYIDIMCANLLNPDIRESFEVILLPNLYGDIITDEAAQIQGGVGTAGSANIADDFAMFEAIHGSAPRLIEKGEGHLASPLSILKAAEMLLSHIGYKDRADILAKAVDKTLLQGYNVSKESLSCKQFCERIVENIDAIE